MYSIEKPPLVFGLFGGIYQIASTDYMVRTYEEVITQLMAFVTNLLTNKLEN